MTNILYVCLFAALCCTAAAQSRPLPQECSKGPAYWCLTIRNAADCNAIGHCTITLWQQQITQVDNNEVSAKFLKLLRSLKDVKDLVSEDYIALKLDEACDDIPYTSINRICRENTVYLAQHVKSVLASNTTAETLCSVLGICNNKKIDNILNLNNNKKSKPSSEELLGAKRCTWGPSYWCSNFSTAHGCKAVGHCVQRVWPTMQVSYDNDAVCEGCKMMVQMAREQLKNNNTQEEIKQGIEQFCKKIPIQSIADECSQEIDTHFSEIMTELVSELDPLRLCTVNGYCNSDRIEQMLEEIYKQKSSDVVMPKHVSSEPLIGAGRCTWGPSYWCSNFSTAHGCKATTHCVQRVWSKMQVAEDTDDICKICKDMVTQARDQLQSNETQEELKQVFEGSCNLIPIKLVREECITLADQFVPELVETLASEMNPSTVCSVAGLCNSRRIDDMLDEYKHVLAMREECNNCEQISKVMKNKFVVSTDDDILVGLLKVCRKFGSYSDACSTQVFTKYEDIKAFMGDFITSDNVCEASGQCAFKYHHYHEEYTFPDNLKALGPNDVSGDVPCELCEQLVKHLREMIVANTTEAEFYTVLKSICKQTRGYKEECLSLVEQYYPVIYNYLESELKPRELCDLIGICGPQQEVPIMPLVGKELLIKTISGRNQMSKLIGQDEANSYKKIGRVNVPKQTNVRVLGTEAPPPLPVERMFIGLPQDKTVCAFCEYFLHYLQVEISDQKNENEIKAAVETACDRLPSSVSGECRQFVEQYGPAVIALLVQEIDPASICPALGLCPKTQEVRRVSINSDSSSCPLCLFAVEQLEATLKNNRSEENIRNALDNLCTHLSQRLKSACVDFVDQYSDALVEMLVADMNAQEICVYLKLCTDSTIVDPLNLKEPAPTTTESAIDKFHRRPELRGDARRHRKPMLPDYMLVNNHAAGGDVETNEIHDSTYNGKSVKASSKKSVCVICEFVMKEIDDQIKDKHNTDEIKKIVHSVCSRMPKSVRNECNQFVDKYADLVIALLAQELDPSEICAELKLCDSTAQVYSKDVTKVKENILDCAVCETVVLAVKKVLANDKVDHDVLHVVEKACGMLPAKYNDRCHTLMEIYGDSVIHLIEEFGTKGVCKKIGLCAGAEGAYVNMYREHKLH